MKEKVASAFIGEMKQSMDSWAHDAMCLAKQDPFEHGRSVGFYQGMKNALDVFEAILAESESD